MPPAPIQKRLNKFIDYNGPGGCWLWTGTLAKGYGVFTCYGKHQAHRFVYEWLGGVIPEGMHLDHLCMVKRCVNPEHLEPVTHEENVKRWAATLTHCTNGHEANDTNMRRRPNGRRQCRVCDRETKRASYVPRGNQRPAGKSKEGGRRSAS